MIEVFHGSWTKVDKPDFESAEEIRDAGR